MRKEERELLNYANRLYKALDEAMEDTTASRETYEYWKHLMEDFREKYQDSRISWHPTQLSPKDIEAIANAKVPDDRFDSENPDADVDHNYNNWKPMR